jgi:hypothetical protein
MNELIESIVNRKLRKKGKDYQLHENSARSGSDFAYANSITKRIYGVSKNLVELLRSQSIYRRLQRIVMKALREDEINPLGKLRLGNGNSGVFKGFSFNENRSWDGLVRWLPIITYDEAQNTVSFNIPAQSDSSLQSLPKPISKAEVKFYTLSLPFELDEEYALSATKILTLKPNQGQISRVTNLPLSKMDNCLILIFGIVRCHLWESSGNTDFLSGNKDYLVSDIVEVFRIKDGRLIEDKAVSKRPAVPSVMEDQGSDWQ